MAKRHAGEGGILSVHRILGPESRTFGSHALPITPDAFHRIVETLLERGYRFLSMSGPAHRLQDPEPKPDRFVCLTFDDGFIDTYPEAFPVCRKLGVPITVYLVSAFLRREFPMWALGVDALIAANDAVGLHGEGRRNRPTDRANGGDGRDV